MKRRGKSSHPARKRIWNSDPASFWGICLPLLITFIKIPWYEISRKLTPIAYHQVEPGESELVLSNNSIASCKERCIRTRHESKYWTPRIECPLLVWTFKEALIKLDFVQIPKTVQPFQCETFGIPSHAHKNISYNQWAQKTSTKNTLLKLKGWIPKIAIIERKHLFTYKPIIVGIRWLNFQGVTSWY